jgi:DNA-binding PadR family transcriptional regulator
VSVPYALLALLTEGPKYGLRLQNEFESKTGEVLPLNVGQVYTTLQRLERDGLVASDGNGERSRKRYKLTPAGSQELAGWLRTPPELVPPPRDELVIKVLVALQIPGIDVGEILQVHRRQVIEVMQPTPTSRPRPRRTTCRSHSLQTRSSSGSRRSSAGSMPPTHA